MENIDKFFTFLYDGSFENSGIGYIAFRDRCIANIADKALSMNEKNQQVYCRLILDYFWDITYGDEEFNDTFYFEGLDNVEEKLSDKTEEAIWFLIKISNIFKYCGISMNELSEEMGYKKVTPIYFEKKDKHSTNNKKRAKATSLQQWAVLRVLMEGAVNWRLTDNNNKLRFDKTKIAEFVSFICGGSPDVIRKQLEKDLPAKDVDEILPYLNNIGLHEIAEKIKDDYK